MTKRLNLSTLKQGLPGISPAMATAHMEAALVCLNHHQHSTRVDMTVHVSPTNDVQYEVATEITHKETIDERLTRTWGDLQEATEFGAAGIAFMLIRAVTGYTVVERSRKGTGFDYWLRRERARLPFQSAARLEVSGILEAEKMAIIRNRVRAKLNQTAVSDKLSLPVYIVVVEFSRPVAYVVRR